MRRPAESNHSCRVRIVSLSGAGRGREAVIPTALVSAIYCRASTLSPTRPRASMSWTETSRSRNDRRKSASARISFRRIVRWTERLWMSPSAVDARWICAGGRWAVSSSSTCGSSCSPRGDLMSAVSDVAFIAGTSFWTLIQGYLIVWS